MCGGESPVSVGGSGNDREEATQHAHCVASSLKAPKRGERRIFWDVNEREKLSEQYFSPRYSYTKWLAEGMYTLHRQP